MDKPVCKLCGTKHWRYELDKCYAALPDVEPEQAVDTPKPTEPKAHKPKATVSSPSSKASTKSASEASTKSDKAKARRQRWREAHQDAYRKYQREYMSKRKT